MLFEAAAQSASLTIEINLGSLKDPELKRKYSEKLVSLMREITERKNEVIQVTRDRF
jgi:formiminotetrahydrofolate cyclodeaminase